jgi:hypothetical protein
MTPQDSRQAKESVIQIGLEARSRWNKSLPTRIQKAGGKHGTNTDNHFIIPPPLPGTAKKWHFDNH